MFAVLPTSPFTFGDNEPFTPYRPVKSSPLSSSPTRATSPPPQIARDPDLFPLPQRETQSSPIPAPASGPKFRFADRNARANPVVQKREDAREGRRKLFLNNVRQRADDKKWERRGGDNELLKLEWWRLNNELRQAKNTDTEGILMDEEIEDEAQIALEANDYGMDADDMMADVLANEEEAELDALLSSMPQDASIPLSFEQPSASFEQSGSPHFSDDEDYDSLFMDFLSQQSQESTVALSQDVEMS